MVEHQAMRNTMMSTNHAWSDRKHCDFQFKHFIFMVGLRTFALHSHGLFLWSQSVYVYWWSSSLHPVSTLVAIWIQVACLSICIHVVYRTRILFAWGWALFNRPNHSQGMRSQAVFINRGPNRFQAVSTLVVVDVCSTLGIILTAHDSQGLWISGCIRIDDPTASSLSACS